MKRKEKNLADNNKGKSISYNIAVCFNEEIDEKGIGVFKNKVFLEAVIL